MGATDALNSGQGFDFEKSLDTAANKLKGTGLGKDNKSKNLPTGVKKSEAQPIAEKYGISLGEAGKLLISIRAAQSKHNHFQIISLKKIILKIPNQNLSLVIKKVCKLKDMIAQSKGRVFLGNTEVSKEEALK